MKKHADTDELINAIVKQAAEDWRDSVWLMRLPKAVEDTCLRDMNNSKISIWKRADAEHLYNLIKDAPAMKEDCEEFFLSDWCKMLIGFDGAYILEKLQQEDMKRHGELV